jgi:biuret amidohydrolase
MINDFLLPGAPFESVRAREELVPRLKPLLETCRAKGVLVAYTGNCFRPDGSDMGLLQTIFPELGAASACLAGTPGAETYGEIAPQPGDVVILKRRFDAFHATELEMILRHRGIDTVIVTGTSTSIGTETTARGAVVRDFRVIFPSDGTVNKDLPDAGWGPVSQEELMRVVLTELAQFCRVASIAEIIGELNAAPSSA